MAVDALGVELFEVLCLLFIVRIFGSELVDKNEEF